MSDRLLLDRLTQHQDTILALLRETEPVLTDPARRDIAALGRGRWALARALTGYQYFKHGEIFDPAIAGRLLGGERAARMKAACLAMSDDFRAYVLHWSSVDVNAMWHAYQPAALAMIARLRRHIAHERQEIGRLLDQAA